MQDWRNHTGDGCKYKTTKWNEGILSYKELRISREMMSPKKGQNHATSEIMIV